MRTIPNLVLLLVLAVAVAACGDDSAPADGPPSGNPFSGLPGAAPGVLPKDMPIGDPKAMEEWGKKHAERVSKHLDSVAGDLSEADFQKFFDISAELEREEGNPAAVFQRHGIAMHEWAGHRLMRVPAAIGAYMTRKETGQLTDADRANGPMIERFAKMLRGED